MTKHDVAPRLRPDERMVLARVVKLVHDFNDDEIPGYVEGAERRRIEALENDLERDLGLELWDAMSEGDREVQIAVASVDAVNGTAEIAIGFGFPRHRQREEWALARALYEQQLPRATQRLILALERRRARKLDAELEATARAAYELSTSDQDWLAASGIDPVRVAREPRQRETGARRAPAKRAAGRTADRGDDGGSDGPGSAGPALALAPRPRALLSFGCSRCPKCGGVLLWHGGVLICATRTCSRWGLPA